MNNQFVVLYCRAHVVEKNKFLICGYWKEREKRDTHLVLSLDYKQIPYEIEKPERLLVPGGYGEGVEYKEHLFLWFSLPEDYRKYHKIRLFEQKELKLKEIFSHKTDVLSKMEEYVFCNVDEIAVRNEGLVVKGWCIAEKEYHIRVLDENGMDIPVEVINTMRPDVKRAYPECEMEWIRGFLVKTGRMKIGDIELLCDGKTAIANRNGAESRWKKIWGKLQVTAIKTVEYYYRNGLTNTIKRAGEKLTQKKITNYEEYRRIHMLNKRQLEEQRKTMFGYQPEIDIVVPLYKTDSECLEALIRSVRSQTYSNWKLYLSDGSGEKSPLTEVLKNYEKKDSRICVIQNERRLQIAENTNEALKRCNGEYIAFVDHDDTLELNALYECVNVLNRYPETEFIYTDEDKVSQDGKEYYHPHFKPDFNLDLLRSQNYISHLCVVKKTLLEEVGYLNPQYNGSQDYDFILRCVEKTDDIYHIPKVLYHWRVHPNSVAGNPESKNYAYYMGKKAIEAHYKRVGIEAEVEEVLAGVYHSIYKIKEEPLVTILIPNKDHVADLSRCIESVQQYSSYRNFEILIVENNSETQEIRNFYESVVLKYNNIQVIEYTGEFNYASIHNYAVPKAKGEYILLLNNDTWIDNPDSIREMVSYCMREDVGIVGSLLYYPDDMIQHAGVIVGYGGVAGHAFQGLFKGEPGYFNRIMCTQDYSAVTAASMMVKKSIYEKVNGMEPALQVAFNDTDFCMRVREKGYLVVYNPFSVWYHDESKSRGAEDTPEKRERFQREIDFFQKRWGSFLEQGDPYYNPNLTLAKPDFSLREQSLL